MASTRSTATTGTISFAAAPTPTCSAAASGADTLRGEDGDDSLDGGADTDSCYGDDGVDTATACETAIGIP